MLSARATSCPASSAASARPEETFTDDSGPTVVPAEGSTPSTEKELRPNLPPPNRGRVPVPWPSPVVPCPVPVWPVPVPPCAPCWAICPSNVRLVRLSAPVAAATLPVLEIVFTPAASIVPRAGEARSTEVFRVVLPSLAAAPPPAPKSKRCPVSLPRWAGAPVTVRSVPTP